MKSFASDNYSGIHPIIIQSIIAANKDHASSYGNDSYTEKAIGLFKQLFGTTTEVLFAFNGTGANVIALQCALRSFDKVLCAETAHIVADECGAPAKSTGCLIQTIPTTDGKLTPALLAPHMKGIGNMHNAQPRIISISQSTELGTVYTVDELKNLCDFAHSQGLFVHLDGARIANAVVSLNLPIKECTVDCGIDIMSFGGTKNGLMIGEAILIFNQELAENAQFVRKQATQLFSKMRFISTQFIALLENGLWLEMARHSNRMAKLLAEGVNAIPQVEITQKVEANGVFAKIPPSVAAPLQQEFPFYLWDESTCEARWMCSFDTTEEEIRIFVERLKRLCSQTN
jgi:threonine aldolase